jgi:hypothetical protein
MALEQGIGGTAWFSLLVRVGSIAFAWETVR